MPIVAHVPDQTTVAKEDELSVSPGSVIPGFDLSMKQVDEASDRSASPRRIRRPSPEPPAPTLVCGMELSEEFLARGAEERAARAALRAAHPRVSLSSLKGWMHENNLTQSMLENFLANPVPVSAP